MIDLNYRELLERLTDAVIVADASDHIVYANAACEALLGWPVGMLIKQPLTIIQPPRMRAKHLAGFKHYFRTHESRILNKPIRVPALRRDGTELELELTLSTQQIDAGEELVVGCLRNLRDRVELERQQMARSEAEMRAERAEFLDEAGRELTSSLDYEATLTRIARLAVSKIADWCIIDMVDETERLRRLAVIHSDPAKEAMAEELARRYPPAARAEAVASRVARTGAAELVAEITDAMLTAIAQDDEHLDLLRNLGLASYISVPLKARGRTLGVLTCIAAKSNLRYGADDLVLLEGLARHAGQAIDNARLFGELGNEITKRREREVRLARLSRLYAVLAQVNEALVRVPEQTSLFEKICRIVVETGGFCMAWVGLIDSSTETLRPSVQYGSGAETYLAGLELTLGNNDKAHGPAACAVQEGHPAICNDIANDQHMRPWRDEALACGYRASAALPLRIHDHVIGVFNVYTGEEDFFDAEGARLFKNVADDVSFALEALDWERRRAEAEEALRGERAFLATLLQNLKDGIVACDAHGEVTLFNSAARELHGLPAEPSLPEQWTEQPYELLQPESETRMTRAEKPLYRALAGEAFREVEMVIAPINCDRRVVVCSGQPLYNGAVRQVGAVITLHDITARKQAEARLLRQAFHDPLTGLPNRRLLIDRLRHALARGKRQPSSLAVLFIDLDRLKVINDNFGHETGDQALVMIAERLRETVRSADSVARLGGDEFVVVCEDLAGENEAVALSHRLAKAVSMPCVLKELDAEVVVTASVGIALARGEERAEDLLRNADTAMYEAKQRGKARHVLFDDALRGQAVERLNSENALRRAIEENRLRLSYQPIIDLKNAQLIGAEALVRYHDPERGLIMPKEFLDIAEESGLIMPMGNWVLAEACSQTHRWHKILPSFQISINLSTRQIGDPAFMETLNEVITRNALPPGTVGLEITESVLMEAAKSTQRILQQFKDYGPRLGMDDFGTGYSSLTYLRRFPVDFVKIDRSFVRGIGQNSEDTAIVTAVINLGKALGLTSIAEGVETVHQAALLRRLGCDFAQGFYFARPQPADAFTHLLRSPPMWLLEA